MKKNLLLIIMLLTDAAAFAQGLEKIIVEKYYVSDKKDEAASRGLLPAGSVTYRIFADLLPGYKFEAVYGIPGHELKLNTTTYFFNNEDFGAAIPNIIPDRNLKDNTVMLDSWLSTGGSSENTLGILKSEDDSIGTVVSEKGFLQHADPQAGIPLKDRDGLFAGIPPRVTQVGLDSVLKKFVNHSDTSFRGFSTYNGSWACLNGSEGPTKENRVLIAQMTTNGIFSFELNIQLGRPDGGIENYVARKPVGKEIQEPTLIFSSDPAESAKSLNPSHPAGSQVR